MGEIIVSEEVFGGGSCLRLHADGGREEVEGEQRPTGVLFVEVGGVAGSRANHAAQLGALGHDLLMT